MNDLIISGLIALLIGAVGMLSYNLGKRTERNADFEEKKKTMAEVRRLRDSLNDPAVVERLHNSFKR
ncbi:MAG: hypothetical protein IJY17_09380 [Alphaproteobacteria bacterium]|nr:hypothetical protein [Alphaproteobacteria bacterium]